MKNSKHQICSRCNQRKKTVNRYMFDGMCADCVDIALYSDDYTQKAECKNQCLMENEH